MKSIRIGAVVAAGVVVALACTAAGTRVSAGPAEPPSTLSRQKILGHRQQLVRQSLGLDAQQLAAFEPVYADFEAERIALAEDRAGFVDEYAKAAAGVSAEQAVQLTDQFLSLRRQRLELDEKFRPRFAAILAPQKVLLFFQLNFVMDAVVNYDLAGAVPLAK